MKSNKILYTSDEVRKAIIDIFSKSKGRRVAITAFVGNGAEAYLPKPKGIELICWPKAGGTNPNALRELMQKSVKVSFADSLHMKVYWTEDHGAVITSANLSTNALGSGNLREIGVQISSDALDIDRIIQKIKPRLVTKKELDQLETGHRAYYRSNKIGWEKVPAPSFLEWSKDRFKKYWKLGYWDETMQPSRAARERSKIEYNVPNPKDFIGCRVDTYKEHDWILTFRISQNKPVGITWQYVDFVVKTERTDKAYDADFPYQAVQVWSIKHYSEPPFNIKEKHFQNALTKALKKYGVKKFDKEDPSKPPERLLKLIRESY